MTALLIAGLVFALAAPAGAQDIKARMRARLPVIIKLKAQGIVGEDNQGYLAVLKNAGKQQEVVDAENQDRRKIYAAIAKQQGTTPALVGQRRAMKIAQKADPGTMIQDASGSWQQK
jgi:uncharacterized protein YdbL (DUF1318 family)